MYFYYFYSPHMLSLATYDSNEEWCSCQLHIVRAVYRISAIPISGFYKTLFIYLTRQLRPLFPAYRFLRRFRWQLQSLLIARVFGLVPARIVRAKIMKNKSILELKVRGKYKRRTLYTGKHFGRNTDGRKSGRRYLSGYSLKSLRLRLNNVLVKLSKNTLLILLVCILRYHVYYKVYHYISILEKYTGNLYIFL